jgi:predicted hydrocarbon binding protein
MPKTLRTYPPALLQQFIQTANQEVGRNELAQIINEPSLLDLNRISSLNELQAAENFSEIQRRLRVYYGRGARGILLRIGQNLWKPILRQQGVFTRLPAYGIRILPAGMRPKPALDLLARAMRGREGKVSVHSMDLNLLFVDFSSPTTAGLQETQPVCFVTLGLIRGTLFWATGKDHDVEETGCCAMGNDACEFKVVVSGGK